MVEILMDIERETKCPDTLFFPEKENLTLTFGEVVRRITRWRIENNLKNIPMNSPPSQISQYGRLIFWLFFALCLIIITLYFQNRS